MPGLRERKSLKRKRKERESECERERERQRECVRVEEYKSRSAENSIKALK